MQHSLDLREFLENLQNQRFLHPPVAGGFKTRVFRSRGGSICFQWGGAGASIVEIHTAPPAIRPDTPSTYALARAAHCAAQLAARLAVPAPRSQRKSSSSFENPLAEDPQKAAEACHAGKTYEIIRKSRAPAKDSTLRCNFQNPQSRLWIKHPLMTTTILKLQTTILKLQR